MQQEAFDSYLASQILTATPQKLRLMLIDAAISSARKTIAHWESGDNEAACETLIHCRDVISELLSGIKPDESEVAKRVAAIYLFLFKSLTEAQLRRDDKLVDNVIEVLEVERETWRRVCEQMPYAPRGEQPREMGAHEAQRLVDPPAPATPQDGASSGGLVLDA